MTDVDSSCTVNYVGSSGSVNKVLATGVVIPAGYSLTQSDGTTIEDLSNYKGHIGDGQTTPQSGNLVADGIDIWKITTATYTTAVVSITDIVGNEGTSDVGPDIVLKLYSFLGGGSDGAALTNQVSLHDIGSGPAQPWYDADPESIAFGTPSFPAHYAGDYFLYIKAFPGASSPTGTYKINYTSS